MKHLAMIATAAMFSLVACGKAGPELATQPIASSGLVVDLPSGWTVKTDSDRSYSLQPAGDDGMSIQVVVHHSPMPASLDELVQHSFCEDATKATKASLPGGGMFVQCDVKAARINNKDVMAPKVSVVVPAGDGTAECRFTTDKDIATVAAICKTLRKA